MYKGGGDAVELANSCKCQRNNNIPQGGLLGLAYGHLERAQGGNMERGTARLPGLIEGYDISFCHRIFQDA